jgi:hypothetical protein
MGTIAKTYSIKTKTIKKIVFTDNQNKFLAVFKTSEI